MKKHLVTKEEKLTRHPRTQRQDQVAFCKLASHASFTPFESVVQHVLGPYLQYKRDRWQQTTQAVVIGRNDVQRTWLDPLGTTTSTSSTDDKFPKSWPKGVYQQLLTDYKTNTGNIRPFPEKIILGAEKAVVRMWYEQATSKNYQAVGLGEIITNRTFTATGAVNSTAKKGKSDKTWVLDSDNTLIHQEQQKACPIHDDDPGPPRSHPLGLDIDTDFIQGIDAYIDRFIQLTRKNPQRLPNVKEAWDTFSWDIAMKMRNSTSFKQATDDVLQDPVTLAYILAQPICKKTKNDKGKGKETKGKGKSKQKTNHWQPYNRYQP